MNKIPLLFLSFLIYHISYAQENDNQDILSSGITMENIRNSILPATAWVPFPDYSDRAAWDSLTAEYKLWIIENGCRFLDYRWQVVKATDYLDFTRTGSRLVMENPVWENWNALASLVSAELAEGEGNFIDQIVNGSFHFCEMTTWALSAHLYLQRRNGFPDHLDNIFDLRNGDISSLLAWTIFFFEEEFNRMHPLISERICYEVKRRTLDPYLNETRFWWMAYGNNPRMVNNWNPWCNFNAIQCFLLLEDDTERVAQAIHKSLISVDKFINYTRPDGACEEGSSYWDHAAGRLYDYLQLLDYASNGKLNFFDHEIIRNMGEFIARSYVGDGWVVNFADASAKGGGDPNMIFRYGKAVKSPLMISYAAYLNQSKSEKARYANIQRQSADPFRYISALMFKEELETVESDFVNLAVSWYPQSELIYMFKETSGLFFAAKGGHNAESHNHNDVGTFSLYKNNIPMIIDAGVGTYTKDTFGDKRYAIWTMSSDYHNLPVINGYTQEAGNAFKSADVIFNERNSLFKLDISQAYPQEAGVRKWERSYKLNNRQLEITDDYVLENRNEKNIINFLLLGDTDLSVDGIIKISNQGENLVIRYAGSSFTVSEETILIEDPKLKNIWGETVIRISLTEKNEKLKQKHHFTIL